MNLLPSGGTSNTLQCFFTGLDDTFVQDASSHGTTLALVGAIGQVSDAAAASRASGEDEEFTEKEIGGQKDSFTARLGSSTGKNPLALAKPFSRFQSAKSFRIASPGLAFPGAWKADQSVDNIPWLGAVLENTTCAMTVLKWGG